MLHDNPRSHLAQLFKGALDKLEWKSSDFAPAYFHFFRSLSNQKLAHQFLLEPRPEIFGGTGSTIDRKMETLLSTSNTDKNIENVEIIQICARLFLPPISPLSFVSTLLRSHLAMMSF